MNKEEIEAISKTSTSQEVEWIKDREAIFKIKEAGKIAKQAVEYARTIIKPNMPLLEIANKIEEKIHSLKAKPAFPVNLSVNEIAAHSTPSYNDTTLATGLLKVDIGVHIDGYVADNAFSLNLDSSEENKTLIKASEIALEEALKEIKLNVTLRKIGEVIEKACSSLKVQPIHNLSGHSIDHYELHSGITIPNYDNAQEIELPEGLYAIEPFTTFGVGSVKEGKGSGIYHIRKEGNVRDNFAREVLQFINKEYKTLPFCSRWIHKKFGTRGLLALRQIEQAGLLHHYPQLIESSNMKVAQSEHSVLINKNEKIITTK